VLKGHSWRCSVTLRVGLLARQTSSLLRPSPWLGLRCWIAPAGSARQSAEESNPILQIWNLLGHHGLHPIGAPYGFRSRHFPLDRRASSPADSRGVGALGRGRAFVTPFRKRCTGSAGKRMGCSAESNCLTRVTAASVYQNYRTTSQSGWNRTSITRSQTPGTTNIPRPDVGPSSSSRTSLSRTSGERCHRVSCRGLGAPPLEEAP
jgi:hypothetical protein